MSRNVDNMEDVLDSRDIEERIDDLEGLAMMTCPHCGGTTEETQEPDTETCKYCGGSGEITNTSDEYDQDELVTLLNLRKEAEGYSDDWKYGSTLIRDSYFQTYAQELADDIGAVPDGASWPNNCIDWEQAARELQMDYTSVEFDGVTYWVR